MNIDALPVAVIGAGPVGLAAAAHLLERDMPLVILEAGERVGTHLLDYGHVRLFSPWRYNLSPAMTRLLEPTGWQSPDLEVLPLAREIVDRVLAPFAALPAVKQSLRLQHRVTSTTRDGLDKVKTDGRDGVPFVIRASTPQGDVEIRARAVIDSSGTWSTPNPLGASGLPAIGEEEARAQIRYGIPDASGSERERYLGKRVMVVGSGHSAINALLLITELANADSRTKVVWAVRAKDVTRAYGGGEADALPARGELGTALRGLHQSGRLEVVSDFRVSAISRRGGALTVHALGADGTKKRMEGIDEIIGATGQRPNLAMTAELRVKLDPWLESTEALGPLIDPNLHSCGSVRPHGHRELSHPEPGYYTIGVKSYGRAPTFLMATGFEQARSVVAALDGDMATADRTELDLPETGVCSANLPTPVAASCCGTSTPEAVASGGCATSSCAATPVAALTTPTKRCCA